jgi:hypothetical protein
MAEEVMELCRICWVRGQATRPHPTYRCQTRLCSGDEWKSYKSQMRFPPGLVCFLCLAPYGPPFNHDKPARGDPYTGEFCDYPDVLKELSFVLYHDGDIKAAIFTRLGAPIPDTITTYKRFMGKKWRGGLLGLYEVLVAYLDLKEEGAFGQGW